MTDDRVTELEIQLAHQAKQLEELDEVVRAQAAELDLMKRQIRAVVLRMQETAEAMPGSVVLGDETPPHY